MATSRHTPHSRAGLPPAGGESVPAATGRAGPRAGRPRADRQGSVSRQGSGSQDSGSQGGASRDGVPALPPVRLAHREELAALVRVAPLMRAAREVARWVGSGCDVTQAGRPAPGQVTSALDGLDMAAAEFEAAWRVASATGMIHVGSGRAVAGDQAGVLTSGSADEVLAVWDDALTLMLGADDLDGLATALATAGGPVKMDALFEAYAAAAGSRDDTRPGAGAQTGGTPAESRSREQVAGLSSALEALADIGVVELGTETEADDGDGGLTVTLSRLGVWGMHRRLRALGWHVPVLGSGAGGDAAALLATLAACDIEDGEAEIAAWLAERTPEQASRELTEAAGQGSPGLRGAAFAVLDRIGAAAVTAVRAALADPVLRAHAAVWLHEHGEEAAISPADRAWLLVDLGAGLLEEADPRDVVAELLPNVPPESQAELVAGLWEVSHPGLTGLLTTLSDHHPDPAVARAARKAAFKARSRPAGAPAQTS